ncbi:31522_t:CDS:2 [Gigaspora margarita]|uniref:31522_t:CDS:1 n=1 Tax=Gigaspora margarita TaxID=4874 RepID=A0ABN7V882_GIGMA|nr:31522_t:CDS:2 [Gigaspora margarita]
MEVLVIEDFNHEYKNTKRQKLFKKFKLSNLNSTLEHFDHEHKTIDKAWNRIANTIQESSMEIVPRGKRGSNEFYTFLKQATKLHIAF